MLSGCRTGVAQREPLDGMVKHETKTSSRIRWREWHTLFLRVPGPLVGGVELVLGRGHDVDGDGGDVVVDIGSGNVMSILRLFR